MQQLIVCIEMIQATLLDYNLGVALCEVFINMQPNFYLALHKSAKISFLVNIQ